jgi:hypothetical protein
MIVLVVAGLLPILQGCALTTKTQPEYFVRILNKSGRDLDDVGVYFDGKPAARPGMLVKTGEASEGPVTLPVPPQATVQWTDDKVKHTAVAEIKDVPSSMTSEWILYFVIGKDSTLEAKAVRWDDAAARAKIAEGLRPAGEYMLGFVNKTGHDLRELAVYYDGQKVGGAKAVLARVRVGYSNHLTTPFTPEAEIRWIEGGNEHAVKLRLDGLVPKGFCDGTIYFVFTSDGGVTATPIKFIDRQASINLVR